MLYEASDGKPNVEGLPSFFDELESSGKKTKSPRSCFKRDDDYFGIQKSGKTGAAGAYGGNLVIASGEKAVPATDEDLEYIVNEIMKKVPNAELKVGSEYRIITFQNGEKLAMRLTGGGAKGEVFYPLGTPTHKGAYMTEPISSGVSNTTFTFIEEFATAQLFNVANKDDTIDSLYSIVIGKAGKRSTDFYKKCLDMNNSKAPQTIKELFKDVDTVQKFKEAILPILGDWQRAICVVVDCIIHKIDSDIISGKLGNIKRENAFKKGDPRHRVNCSIIREMIAYHPSQLDTFDVDQYADPTDIVLLNEVYTRDGTHIQTETGKKVANKIEYKTRDGNIFNNDEFPDTADPIRYYKAIGISLKKPGKNGAAAHYIGTAELAQSTAVRVAFNEDGTPKKRSDVSTITASVTGTSGYFNLNCTESFARSISHNGKNNIVKFCFRNKNPNSATVSITGEALEIGDARGGGLGGKDLYAVLGKLKDGVVTGPEYLISVTKMKLNEFEKEVKSKDLKLRICKALAGSLKIPFINLESKDDLRKVPSYIKIA